MADTLVKKPSFLRSLISGIGGYIKGAIAGGLVGIIGGAIVGAIAGAIFPPAGAAMGAAALASATSGAIIGGSLLAGIGALAGTLTGVVRSREAATPSAEDVVGLAKVTFAQGVAVGHEMSRAQQHETSFRDRILRERAAQAVQQHQVH